MYFKSTLNSRLLKSTIIDKDIAFIFIIKASLVLFHKKPCC